jgi:hypothetical protein
VTVDPLLLAERAEAYLLHREEALRLKAERASSRCLHEGAESPACWRAWDYRRPATVEEAVRADWCEACVRSQAAHLDYRAAVCRRQAALRSLVRAYRAPAVARRRGAKKARPVGRAIRIRSDQQPHKAGGMTHDDPHPPAPAGPPRVHR